MGFLLLHFSFFRLEFSLKCPNDKPGLGGLIDMSGNGRILKFLLKLHAYDREKKGKIAIVECSPTQSEYVRSKVTPRARKQFSLFDFKRFFFQVYSDNNK